MGRERAEATCQVLDLQGPFWLPNSEVNEVGGVGWGFAPPSALWWISTMVGLEQLLTTSGLNSKVAWVARSGL